MGFRYLRALSNVYTFNAKWGKCLILTVMVIPAMAWTLNLVINGIQAMQDFIYSDCWRVLTPMQEAVYYVMWLQTELQSLFVLFVINYVASGSGNNQIIEEDEDDMDMTDFNEDHLHSANGEARFFDPNRSIESTNEEVFKGPRQVSKSFGG